MTVVRDEFRTLDRTRWLAHYLPMWSSLAESAADVELVPEGVRLSIPPDAPRWCPATHAEPLRVSALQSGNRSGPVGSRLGQQAFGEDLVVAEAQERFAGWLVRGEVAIRCRMDLSPRSMAAMWLAGFEEDPDETGELCVVEVFGRSIVTDGDAGDGAAAREGEGRISAEVGVGVKAKSDPRLTEQFAAPRLAIDVRESHTYAARWNEHGASFMVDGVEVHRAERPPTYPLQVMIAVFDFPAWPGPTDAHQPSIVVNWIEGNAAR